MLYTTIAAKPIPLHLVSVFNTYVHHRGRGSYNYAVSGRNGRAHQKPIMQGITRRALYILPVYNKEGNTNNAAGISMPQSTASAYSHDNLKQYILKKKKHDMISAFHGRGGWHETVKFRIKELSATGPNTSIPLADTKYIIITVVVWSLLHTSRRCFLA